MLDLPLSLQLNITCYYSHAYCHGITKAFRDGLSNIILLFFSVSLVVFLLSLHIPQNGTGRSVTFFINKIIEDN